MPGGSSASNDASGASDRAERRHAPRSKGTSVLAYANSVYPCSFGSNARGGAAPATKGVVSPSSLFATAKRANGLAFGSPTSRHIDASVFGSATVNARRNHTTKSPASDAPYVPSHVAGAASAFSRKSVAGSSMSNGAALRAVALK